MIHEGHRKRMNEKLAAGELLQEHEKLEMLLFNAYPRRNTNPVAHALLNTFGSMKGVFEAELKDLVAIEGVGESVALYIKCVALCCKTAYGADGEEEEYLKNYGDFKRFSAKRLRGRTSETLEVYFLEKSGKVKYIFSRTDSDEHKVSLKREEIPSVIAAVKPYGMLIAHNHLTGGSSPSPRDDKFTSEIQMLCDLNGIILYDHCIYASDNDIFSYFGEGRIDEIKSKYNLNAIIDKTE